MSAVGEWLLDAGRIAALTLLVALPWFAGYLFPDRIMAAGAAVLVCSLLALIGCGLGARRRGPGLAGAWWPIAGFLGWLLAATATSVYLHASLVSLLNIGSYVAMLALFASLFGLERWRRRAWIAVAGAGAVEGIVGLREWTQTVIYQGDTSWRTFGTFYNPNVLAGYLLVIIPAAVVALTFAGQQAREREERPRLALIAAGFVLLIPSVALLLTGSRAGLLGALLGGAVFVVAAPTRLRLRWVLAAAVALAALALVAPPIRARIVSAATQSHSAAFRWYTWVGTTQMVRARPLLGFGPGTFEHAYPRYAQAGFTRMAHQTPLQIAAEAGLPALVLLVAAVGALVRPMILGLREGGARAIEVAAGLAAMAAVGLHNMADYTWFVPAVGLTLSAVAGLSLAAAREVPETERDAGGRAWTCWAGAALALVMLIGCLPGLRAQMLAERGRAEMARQRYRMAAGWLRQAAEADPLDADILQDLGQATAAWGPGGLARAVEVRLRAAELNPLDAGNYLALSQLYRELDRQESALAAARRAIEVHPNCPRAHVVLAQVQEEAGMDEEALETWRALERVHESPVGRYQAVTEVTDFSYAYAWLALGRAAEEDGEVERAKRYFTRAARLAGEFARIQRKREELLRALGNWDEAEVQEAERLGAEAQRRLKRIQQTPEERGES